MEKFFKVSHALFEDEKYKNMSLYAKILYSLMTERATLSQKNGWYDEEKRLYIYFSLKEAMEILGIGKDKCIKVFKELDSKSGCGLIEKKAQGLGKPMIIYILPPSKTGEVLTSNEQKSSGTDSRTQRCGKTEANNININKTNESKTYFNQSSLKEDVMEKRNKCILKIKKNIDYHVLLEKYDEKTLSTVVDIMADCFLNDSGYINLGGTKKPLAVVRERLLKLDFSHIEYVLDCFFESSKEIKNVKSYLLSSLYNAYDTMELYYAKKVKAVLCANQP